MVIKTGVIVSHSGATEWGVGKVLSVSPSSATIQFSDGKSRKIAASHYLTLQPGNLADYTPPEGLAEVVKPPRAPRKKKVVSATVA